MTERRTYEQSMVLLEQALRVTPGASQTGSKAPGRVGPLGAFPLFLTRGDGPYVECVDGHRYVDWFNGNCAVTLGHGHHGVTAAVQRVAESGALLSLPHRLEAHVAERLVEAIACAEQIRFVKTGSEACAAAVRIARIATGRSVIAVCEGQYNGWHDWSVVRNDYTPGVPDFMHDGLVKWRYNDLPSLELALQQCAPTSPEGAVAAVMLEPTLVEAPAAGFLEGVVDLAHRYGALVIFDEMITGARWALGGAQQHFGVVPDLATFGKAYANGYPLAFVAGRAELMQHAWPISGTFSGDLVSLAACNAVLDEHSFFIIDGPIRRMWDVGQRLMDGVNGICQRLGLPARMAGYPVHPVLTWNARAVGGAFAKAEPDQLSVVIVALFQQELAQAGILAHPSGWNPSAAHDSVALERTLAGVDQALTVVAAALASNDPRTFLRGQLLKPAFVRQAVTT
jgi:glutamate-1-semialdehyde aminotransferase